MLAACLAMLACGAAAGGARPPELGVPRCCAAGWELDAAALGASTLRAEQAAAACRPLAPGAAGSFAPRVYAPARATFLRPGQLPAHWHVEHAALPACEELRVLLEHAAPYALLANNGSLLESGAARATPTSRYCADAAAALVCVDPGQEAEDGEASFKCCAAERVFDGARCVQAETAARAALEELRAFGGGGAVRFGFPACAGGSRYAVTGALASAQALEGGTLALGAAVLARGVWCADAVPAEGSGAHVLACEAAARSAPGAEGTRPARELVYGVGLAVGAAFLAATLAAGFALPAAHHALHWRCQTHYVAALMLGDALLAGTQLAGDRVPSTLCRALGEPRRSPSCLLCGGVSSDTLFVCYMCGAAVCMHFLFLSAFFWLNTMCFNIWWTFRDFRPTSLERGQEAWRLRVYMVYAWGGPLLVAGAGALLDALPPPPAGDHLLRPRFAVQRCWFYGDMEILVYFFGPVGVLLLVNLALFVSTTRQLTCGLWRRDEVKSTSERAALGRVCAKLVVVMGVTWGADVVSWAVGGPEYVWYATDLLNALQGVFIFLVVGCQPHAWAALKRGVAACWARGGRGAGGGEGGAGGGEGGTRATHSSTHLPSCGESLTHTTPVPAPPPNDAAPRLPMETVC